MTSKPYSERPGASSWRKEKKKRAPPHRLRRRLWLSAFPGHLAPPPEYIQILIGSVPGRDCLNSLNLKKPYDIFPLAPSCLSRPQVYVEEHLAPTGDLSF